MEWSIFVQMTFEEGGNYEANYASYYKSDDVDEGAIDQNIDED